VIIKHHTTPQMRRYTTLWYTVLMVLENRTDLEHETQTAL